VREVDALGARLELPGRLSRGDRLGNRGSTFVDRVVTVSSIGSGELFTLGADEWAPDGARVLETLGFDVAGVAGDPVTHFVRLTDLAEDRVGRVGECAVAILAADTIESSSPLAVMIDALATREFVFVLERDRVRSLVTRADLQAPVVGVVALGYLVAIETGLTPFVVRELGSKWFFQLAAPSGPSLK
jgi:hypothetical protein